MDTNKKGNIGEAAALQYFIENDYEVYVPFGTATKCDLIVLKDNRLYRVSVKATSYFRNGKYGLKISQGTGRGKITPFDTTSCDILVAYIVPEKVVKIYKSEDIKARFELTV